MEHCSWRGVLRWIIGITFRYVFIVLFWSLVHAFRLHFVFLMNRTCSGSVILGTSASSTEDAIKQLRSRRPMSAMVVSYHLWCFGGILQIVSFTFEAVIFFALLHCYWEKDFFIFFLVVPVPFFHFRTLHFESC